MMHPERFPDFAVLQKYAECHGLEYVWEGTNAFVKRQHSLSPDQFEIVEVQTKWGTSRALLFSKDILVTEWLADKPRRDRLAAKRARLGVKRAWTKRT